MPYPDAMQTAMTQRQRGFTLIEAVMVITITGIIAAAVAIFIRTPIQSYFDLERRVEMSDAADTALRRIGRDLRLALPNSVRVTADSQAIEFLQTRTGGRYRADIGDPGADMLDFSGADTSFDVLGTPITLVAGDQIVIYNLGIPGADAYEGNTDATHVRRAYSGAAGAVSNVAITSGAPFPFDSPGHRFQVVDTPVTYRCNAGTLTRYSAYAISTNQPNPPAGGTGSVLAQNVSACTFTYDPSVNQRIGLVSMSIAISKDGETVNLYHEVHVSNVP